MAQNALSKSFNRFHANGFATRPTSDFSEIANQAFSGSLMKTNFQKAPCQFRLDMPILGDVAFWGEFGKHCRNIIQVNQPLCKYRWHGDNSTNNAMPGMQALILDEWRVMQ